jgi:glycosyltransferase involved in cell wall biosynthesis
VLSAIQLARLTDIGHTNFGPVDVVIGLKFPAYLVPHDNKVLWLLHQYRQMYELWNEPGIGFSSIASAEELQAAVHSADRQAIPEHRKVFALSGAVRERLRMYCGFDAEVLYPPIPDMGSYHAEQSANFFFFPSRITPLKRQALVVEALAKTRQSVCVRMAGEPDTEAELAHMTGRAESLGVCERLTIEGFISVPTKRDLYARCIGVVFPSRLEDYGFVAAEAMLSSKPVICCSDSGGVLELVVHGESGLVVEPTPEAIADALDCLWADRALARRLGAAGKERITALAPTWEVVTTRLLA